MIRLENVVKIFSGNLRALDGVSLCVRPGEVLGVVGPSGSGKSTLLRCINGLEIPDGGKVTVNGCELLPGRKSINRVRRQVGMVFQSFNLFPHMTAEQNVSLAQRMVQKKTAAEADRVSREVLRSVGMEEKAGSYPHELSGGQQQRVAIARALALEPRVMLLDEITSALDPEMIGEVLDVVKGIARKGATMVVVTHEMGFAREVCRNVVFMENGRVVEESPAQRFFSAPATERARDFLAKVL
ncbi:MAG: amino acid ABC transporter ATP-binding protein [Thermodesulfobacteriota bacterium]